MTHKEQFIEMLDTARISWGNSNMGADIVVRGAAFRFSPNGELSHVFSTYDEDDA